jgi:hypothetical protein
LLTQVDGTGTSSCSSLSLSAPTRSWLGVRIVETSDTEIRLFLEDGQLDDQLAVATEDGRDISDSARGLCEALRPPGERRRGRRVRVH